MSDTVRTTGFEGDVSAVLAITPQTASGVTPILSAAIDLTTSTYARRRMLVVGKAICGNLPSVTTTQASNLFNSTAHGLVAGDAVTFTSITTTTGFVTNTTYYVIASGLTANAFKVSTTVGGSTITMATGDGSAVGHAVGVIGGFTVTESATSGGSYTASTVSAGTAPTTIDASAAATGSTQLVSVQRNAAKPFIKVTYTATARGQTTLCAASVLFISDSI